ncbi:MAG: corrinoid protein [Clostridia bacterium]|jgi:5-methyltetrahydrofolate--homocysteine methyltransferase|nr:corrinoid protein [Clostridia bacterium]MDD4502216.1 corrinoid protein [Clostridia bacterium]HQM95514.1 corrinoid protein [Clostridia bacterium]HQO69753.1 corrinoid protein [Clostridia bacterium]
MSNLQLISESVQKGRAKETVTYITEAIKEGVSASDILNNGLLDGMSKLGVRFKNNEVYVPDVLVAARALTKGLEELKPLMISEDIKPIGKVVLGTVKGDLHDIGKNLVKMMLIGNGFEVTDLGVDVSAESFVNAVKENEPDIVALSALLTTTMSQQGEVVNALKANGLREKVKIMVGGAPVTQTFCDEIGADAYAADAASSAELAKSFVIHKQ